MIRLSFLCFLRSNSVLRVSARLFKHKKLSCGAKHFSKQAVQGINNALCVADRQILLPSLCSRSLLSRCFNLSSILNIKQHADSENTLAHLVFERIESPYSNCIAPVSPKLEENVRKLSDEDFQSLLSDNWESLTSTELVESFGLISHHIFNKQQNIDISNVCFDSMCHELVKKCKEFNFDQFCKVLHYLSFWPPTETSKSHNFKEVSQNSRIF